jgi:hypothetical protein
MPSLLPLDPRLGFGILATLLMVLALFLVSRRMPHRGLVWYDLNGHDYHQRPSPSHPAANGHVYMIENLDRAAVEDVEVLLDVPPTRFELRPQRPAAVTVGEDRRTRLAVGRLEPGEKVAVTILMTAAPPPAVRRVEWRDGIARQVLILPRRPFWRHPTI